MTEIMNNSILYELITTDHELSYEDHAEDFFIGEIMRRFKYSKDAELEIKKHEKNMLSIYTDEVEKYKSEFAQYGCDLTTILFRNKHKIQNGYECYVCCIASIDSKDVRIKGDEEADYYDCSCAIMIAGVWQKGFSLEVKLFDIDITEFDEEIEHMLEMLSSGEIISDI